tara:strand:+ start:15120 stop:17021 length:1902 start_codon:yes stop_codon:yes gene_type:complete
MNPAFVIMAVRAAIRIGKTAEDAYRQYAQERPVFLPDADRIKGDKLDNIRVTENMYPEFARMLKEDPELSKHWKSKNFHPADADEATKTFVASAAAVFVDVVKQKSGGDAVSAITSEEIVGGAMVGQWATGKGPVSPMSRMIVAMADVGLEYIAAQPNVLGIGGDGEKLIGAVAGAVSAAIPDAADRTALGPKDRFAERLAGVVLRAGLKTMVDKPDLLFGEAHLQELLKSSLPHVIEALPTGPGSLQKQIAWRDVTDAVLGPAIGSAMEVVASQPNAFLGRKFAAEKAAGVMIAGVLTASAQHGERFSKEGLLAVFRAAVHVAAENPALVLGDLIDKDLSEPDSRSAIEALGVSVFDSVLEVLDTKEGPFRGDLGVAIAAAVIAGVRKAGPAIIDKNAPWEITTQQLLDQILGGMSEALLDDNKSLKSTVFTEATLVELARVVVDQVAKTPHMLVGNNEDVRRIVASMARAIAADEKLLLTEGDWKQIAAVAAQEAALNPARLFGLNEKSLNGMLADDVIRRLLNAASEDVRKQGGNSLMVGETLRFAVITTLRGIAGNVDKALSNRVQIETLANKLNAALADKTYEFGGKEWQHLFKMLLPSVLKNGTVPELTDAKIAELLSKRNQGGSGS